MIAYHKKDAQAAFTELADILEKTAATEIGGGQPGQRKGNAVLLAEIERIVEASPTADLIRTAFEKAWDVAARAGDAETERELHTRHIDLIADFNAVVSPDSQDDARETYQRHLRSHAAWVRAVAASIDDSDRRTDTQPVDGGEIARKVADAFRSQLKDIQADTTATALNMATISNGVDFLVQKRKQQFAVNRKRGKDSQRKGDHEEAVRAARDMADALKKVAAAPDVKAGKHGAILEACRKVCDWELNGVKHHGRFRPLTTKRNADGSFAEYAPLTDKSGKPIKPETLARQFRDSRGTRKERAKK